MSFNHSNLQKESSMLDIHPNITFPIACIGSSAGGIEALTEFVSTLEEQSGIAYIVIQHLDPNHESQLPRIVSKLTSVPVVQAVHNQEIQPDNIYIIPSDKVVTIQNGILILADRPSHMRQMTIDSFMRSLAFDQGSKAIGIVLSGVGSDGAIGMKEIKAYGGITFVQDLKSAKYDGMPKSALLASNVDFVMKPSEMPYKLKEVVNHAYLNKLSDEKEEDSVIDDKEKLSTLFSLLHEYSGIDFTNYKRATVRRRVMRRLAVNRLDSLESYVNYTEKHQAEVEELYQDLLIGVTSFFRESESYELLSKKVFPEIFANRIGEEPIRIWVPGCSSGEEVYSILICLIEYMKKNNIYAPVQAFGTDINDFALDKARRGFYVGNITLDVSEDRIKQFFMPVGSRYQVKKTLRNLCIFAKQDLISDPPFPRIDLISCRNMLIYLNPELQEKVISNFHYALKPKGILILGISETIGDVPEQFQAVDKKYKIYSRSNTFQRLNVNIKVPSMKDTSHSSKMTDKANTPKWQSQSDQILLSKYSPPAVVVDENLDILQFRGQDNPFLRIGEGKASLNLTKLTRDGLSVELRKIVQESKKELLAIKKDGILVKCNDEIKILNLEILPLTGSSSGSTHFLITFFDATQLQEHTLNETRNNKIPLDPSINADYEKLHRETVLLKQNLQSTIENYEFVNRELKTANDEILSTNEELKIINEEFETAKEELQSSNEELTTVNEELQERIHELNITNDNFSNLFGSISIPIIVLDLDSCITHLTTSATKILNLSINDIGRDINTLRLNIDLPNVGELVDKVVESKKDFKQEVKDHKSHSYLMTINPYRQSTKKIEGVIIDFQPLLKA